ncbi:DNA-J related domain-containing protein [Vibrio mimicus]|uniref:DNA-J related domain-containing protein n=1 Tax=Vibrio mimicus TaxID=674 RepID=UPI003B834008
MPARKRICSSELFDHDALYPVARNIAPRKVVTSGSDEIILMPMMRSEFHEIDVDDPLRDYYTQWMNYEANGR